MLLNQYTPYLGIWTPSELVEAVGAPEPMAPSKDLVLCQDRLLCRSEMAHVINPFLRLSKHVEGLIAYGRSLIAARPLGCRLAAQEVLRLNALKHGGLERLSEDCRKTLPQCTETTGLQKELIEGAPQTPSGFSESGISPRLLRMTRSTGSFGAWRTTCPPCNFHGTSGTLQKRSLG